LFLNFPKFRYTSQTDSAVSLFGADHVLSDDHVADHVPLSDRHVPAYNFRADHGDADEDRVDEETLDRRTEGERREVEAWASVGRT